MKKLILSVLAVLAIAVPVVGCGLTNTSSDNTELEGTWTGTVSDTDIGTLTITFSFSGNNWELIEIFNPNIIFQVSGTFTIDPTANPKTLDLYITDCPTAPEHVGTTMYSIYQLSGTNLELALGEAGSARPASFTEDNTITLIKQ